MCCAGGARGEGEGLPGLAERGDHPPQEEGAAVQDGAGRAAGQGERLVTGPALTRGVLQMGSAIEDVTEWEQKVEDCQDNFQKISEVIKVSGNTREALDI